MRKIISWSLSLSILLFAGGSPGSAQEPAADNKAVAAASLVALSNAAAEIDVAQLLAGGQVIEGVQGTLNATAFVWQFDQFSADGLLVFDGDLNLNVLATPITMQGELQVSGAQEGVLGVDMTIDLSEEEPVLGGNITYNGETFAVEELAAGMTATAVEGVSWGRIKVRASSIGK